VERQLILPFRYRGLEIQYGFRVDLLVDRKVVVEMKCTEKHAPIHSRQVLTYLRLLDLRHGILLNFGQYRMVDGIHRILNGFAAESLPEQSSEQHAQRTRSTREH
jgi:iron complex transport system substrate-binding protein